MFHNSSNKSVSVTRIKYLDIYHLHTCHFPGSFQASYAPDGNNFKWNSSSYTMYPQQVFWHIEHCASDSEINQIAGCQLTNQGTNKLVIEVQAWNACLVCIMDPAGMTWHGPVRYNSDISCLSKDVPYVLQMSEKAYSPRWICNHMRSLTRPLWYNVCWCLGPFLSPDIAGPWLSLCRVLNRAFSAPLTRNKYHINYWESYTQKEKSTMYGT